MFNIECDVIPPVDLMLQMPSFPPTASRGGGVALLRPPNGHRDSVHDATSVETSKTVFLATCFAIKSYLKFLQNQSED